MNKHESEMSFQEFLDYYNPVPDTAPFIMSTPYTTAHLHNRKNQYFTINTLDGLTGHAMVQRMNLYQAMWARFPQQFWTVCVEERPLDSFLHADMGAIDLHEPALPTTAYSLDGVDAFGEEVREITPYDDDGDETTPLGWSKRYIFKSGMVRQDNVLGFIITEKPVPFDENVTVIGYDQEVEPLVLRAMR